MHGDPALPRDFDHLPYANPNAPKGGRLAVGAPADLVLFDLDRAWQVKDGQLPGKAQNSPFDGRALEGRVTATFKAGRKVFSA